ncbi:NADH-quinone oxidoreductase subunit C [Pseudonocardia sp. N23]|uniref:hydrogenase large subunit n=1 Tax=Pseudonocardia sp. N23 TaxID=1987376 RepID=UPI000BFD8307|nr:NADH-quinone oxidoreductase subunit C [Pseudonocardia sp. N23]GAY12915.1 formate hydrogenlyase subunit 5 [Pseudonocardia sp. N23]
MTTFAEPAPPRRARLTLTPGELPGHAAELLDQGFRLALVGGHDDRPAGGGLRVVHLFTDPTTDTRTELHVPLDPATPHVPSLAALSFPAGRFERETRDLFGIVPDGHPLPRRLVRHFHWPRGWYPMRSDAGPPSAFGDVDGPYPFRTVDGAGVYEIPVGPVHAGMIGPGHFRFSVVGETVLKLKARLWFVHRGIEKHVEGRAPADALPIAERISGDTTVGHALAFCQAVEEATGALVGADARVVRAVLLELERLHNHAADIGALCNDVGHGILNAHALRVREQLLRVNDRVSGHRLLRGAVVLGGTATVRLPDPAELAGIAADVAEIVDLALGHSVVRDRFAGTAALTQQQAADLGTLGYVARASGLTADARFDHPTVAGLPRHPSRVDARGDVLARFLIRAEEFADSVAMISALVARPAAAAADHDQPQPARGTASGVGIVEGWRGTIVHRVELGPEGTVRRLKVVDPSFLNWPALPVALTGSIVPDFPLVNKSFNLSYAGNDL